MSGRDASKNILRISPKFLESYCSIHFFFNGSIAPVGGIQGQCLLTNQRWPEQSISKPKACNRELIRCSTCKFDVILTNTYPVQATARFCLTLSVRFFAMLVFQDRNQFAPRLSQSFATLRISPKAVLRAVSAIGMSLQTKQQYITLELCLIVLRVTSPIDTPWVDGHCLPIIQEVSHSRLQTPAVQEMHLPALPGQLQECRV